MKNILCWLDTYESYTFLPICEKAYPDYDLFVNEDNIALIARTVTPLMTLDIRRPSMVTAFQEHLLRKADAVGYEGIYREKVRMALRSLIQELGG